MSDNNEEFELNISPLCQQISNGDQTFQVDIYEDENSRWILEIVGEEHTSIVWDDTFATDADALTEATKAIITNAIYETD